MIHSTSNAGQELRVARRVQYCGPRQKIEEMVGHKRRQPCGAEESAKRLTPPCERQDSRSDGSAKPLLSNSSVRLLLQSVHTTCSFANVSCTCSYLPQIDDVLKALNGVRYDQAGCTCPRGFFLVPTDKTTWSWSERADCFSLYTKNVQLFFVCRLFFEELKTKAETERNGLIAGGSNTQYEHEFSEHIPLELPREVVAKQLHAIRLSAKIVKVLVTASSLGLSVGNLVPALSFKEEDELLGVVQSHLAAVEEHAASGEPAEELNLLQSWKRRWRKFFKFRRNPRHLGEAGRALQGYLDQKHPGVWQDKVLPKLEIVPNLHSTDYAYICKTDKHKSEWTGRS